MLSHRGLVGSRILALGVVREDEVRITYHADVAKLTM